MPLIGKFPFKRVGHSPFGPIDRPLVDVFLQASDEGEIVPVKMLVDTGADYTLLPACYSGLLGISLKKHCYKSSSLGIGGTESVYLCKKKVRIFIFSWSAEIPLGFLERDNIPALLGRISCLDKLSLLVRRKVTFFAR